MALNLDQVLNSIEDKAITEIRNSLESHLSQGQQSAQQQHHFHSYSGDGARPGSVGPHQPPAQHHQHFGGGSFHPSNGQFYQYPPSSTSSSRFDDSLAPKLSPYLNGSGVSMQNNNNSNYNNNNSKSLQLGSNMPTNEPVKLVYPVSGTVTSTSGGIVTSGKFTANQFP